MSPDRTGSRGGKTPDLEKAQTLFDSNREWESKTVRAAILLTALERGEYHGDHAAEWTVSEPNIIGAQVNALAKTRLITNTHPASGHAELRKAEARARHGGRSYVWWLTSAGDEVARAHQRDPATMEAVSIVRGPRRIRPGETAYGGESVEVLLENPYAGEEERAWDLAEEQRRAEEEERRLEQEAF